MPYNRREVIPLSDEDNAIVDAAYADHESIQTSDQAKLVMKVLDQEIVGIQVQIDLANIRAAAEGVVSESREAWLRKASYAQAMKVRLHRRIFQRDLELRAIRLQARPPRVVQPPPPPKDPAVGLAKQARLQAEAEARSAAAHAKRAALNQQREDMTSWRREFVALARETLPQDIFDALVEKARTRRDDALHLSPAKAPSDDRPTENHADHGEDLPP